MLLKKEKESLKKPGIPITADKGQFIINDERFDYYVNEMHDEEEYNQGRPVTTGWALLVHSSECFSLLLDFEKKRHLYGFLKAFKKIRNVSLQDNNIQRQAMTKMPVKKVLLIDHDRFTDMAWFIDDIGSSKREDEFPGDYKATHYDRCEDVLANWSTIKDYNLIIMELMMIHPKNFYQAGENEDWDTGETLYKRIEKEFPEIPIVVLTHKPKRESQIYVKDKLYIEKPLVEAKILEVLRLVKAMA